jgi:hypothetical protein
MPRRFSAKKTRKKFLLPMKNENTATNSLVNGGIRKNTLPTNLAARIIYF